MFCTHCGKKNPPQANFCFNCGTRSAIATSTEVTASDTSFGASASYVSSVAQTTESADGKQCPSCGLWSPGHADKCDCGFDFRRDVVISKPPVTNINGIGWYFEAWKKYGVFSG